MPFHPGPRPATAALALLTAMAVPLASHAQTAAEAKLGATLTLDPIILSAGLTPVPQDEYGRAATVLDGDALREKGVQTLTEALREVPGISLVGSDPATNTARIRGHSGAQTLVLIDGVEQIADLGGTALGRLPIADIARIEVLRGPQAASIGTGAAAGVISIVTRQSAPGLHYGGSVEAGGARGASAWVSQRGARAGILMATEWREDLGWDVSGDGGEKDGVISRGIRLAGDAALTDDLTVGFNLRRATESYDFDTTSFGPTSESDYIVDDRYPHGRADRQQGQLWLEWRATPALTHRLSYDDARYERTNAFSAAFPATETDVSRRALRYRLSYALDGRAALESTNLVSLMAERVVDDSPLDDRFDRATNTLALEYRGEVAPGLSVQGAVRRDANDAYRDATSWNAALAYVIPGRDIKLHASAGDGRRKPVFYELFGDGIYTIANPDLAPERVRSLDAGVTLPLGGRGQADVTLFAENATDRIAYVSQPDFTGQYRNVPGTSKRRGVEASFQWEASDQLALRGHATWLRSTDPQGEQELRIPRSQIGLGATWTTADGRGSLSADLRHLAGLRDMDQVRFAPVKLDSFSVIDAAGRWALNDAVALTARVDNLTDSAAVDVWGYASRGRTAYVGLAANF
ncbi:TonB-dependent receptor [Paracoccus suum]|uniref:TonB-dependent receptor n=1 Tax=Paracoccus suum TaxID=2259340 RepID=A0A344PJM2_9RHOB|nr:TonB-dependent receptor [Paracoccus suum]AXC49577.1 TonB-dependent receptor [Paracoccus suum]